MLCTVYLYVLYLRVIKTQRMFFLRFLQKLVTIHENPPLLFTNYVHEFRYSEFRQYPKRLVYAYTNQNCITY